MRRTRKALFIIAAVAIVGGVTLLLAEGFLRLFPGFLPPERRQYMLVDMNNVGVEHPYIGHLQTPNAKKRLAGPDYDVRQTTGAFGFRNSGSWPTRADVVILGDSLVFGYGVTDGSAWPAIVERSFPNLKLVNLGLVGAGAEQYLRVYETFGEPLRPKLVIVGMFPGNDFWDAGQFHEWLEEGARGNYMVWRNYGHYSGGLLRHPARAMKSLLLRHSYVYNLALAARANHEAKRAGEPRILRLKSGQEIRLLPSDFRSRTAGSWPGRPEFELTVRALSELRNRVEAADAELLVVLQPSKEEIYLPMWGEEIRDASAALRPALKELGIRFLDLTPAFKREALRGKALFFEADGHPNPAGYNLIAGEVVKYLAGWSWNTGASSALRHCPAPLHRPVMIRASTKTGGHSPFTSTRQGGER